MISLLLFFKELISEYINKSSLFKSNLINIHSCNPHKRKFFGLPSKFHFLPKSALLQSDTIGDISFITLPSLPPRKVFNNFQGPATRSFSLEKRLPSPNSPTQMVQTLLKASATKEQTPRR